MYKDLKEMSYNNKYKNYINFSCLIAFLIGSILKIIFPTNRPEFEKNHKYLLGIAMLNKNFFLHYGVIQLIMIILIFYFYYLQKDLLHNYLLKIRCSYLFKNLMLIVAFLIFYNALIQPIYVTYKFKISGHYFVSIITLVMYSNLLLTADNFIQSNYNSFQIIKVILISLSVYYVYLLVFTAYLYHTIIESFSGIVLGILVSGFFSYFEIDVFCLKIIFPKIANNYSKDDLIREEA